MTGPVRTKLSRNAAITYKGEWHNGQLPNYKRCLAATRSPGDVTVRHTGALHDTGQSLSKLVRFGLVCGWQRRANMENITSITSIQRTETLVL